MKVVNKGYLFNINIALNLFYICVISMMNVYVVYLFPGMSPFEEEETIDNIKSAQDQ